MPTGRVFIRRSVEGLTKNIQQDDLFNDKDAIFPVNHIDRVIRSSQLFSGKVPAGLVFTDNEFGKT